MTLADDRVTLTRTHEKPVMVHLSPNTVYIPRSQNAIVTGLKPGEQVAAYGPSRNAPAGRVEYDTAPFLLPGVTQVAGAVISIHGTVLTVKLTSGKAIPVRLLPVTHYSAAPGAGSNAPYLSHGRKVTVTGQQMTNDEIEARAIVVGT